MTTNHPIVAQPWQLKPDLGAVLVPLLPEPKFNNKDLVWTYKDSWYWKTNETFGEHFYDSFDYKIGDRIYLQEPWYDVVREGITLDYFVEEDAPKWDVWYPAHTMPPEAARFCYEITSVEVVQAKALDMPTLIASKLTSWGEPSEDLLPLEPEVAHNWNKCNPEHPWHGDRFVVVLRTIFFGEK